MSSTKRKQALRIILDRVMNFMDYPTNQEMIELLGISRNDWQNIRRELFANGSLRESDIFDFEISHEIIEKYRKSMPKPETKLSKDNELSHPGLVNIPLLGPIAAGIPIHIPSSDFTSLESVPFPKDYLPKDSSGNVYALLVNGDSMKDAMVLDGDIVILKTITSELIRDGEMVAAWLPTRQETTLKYYHLVQKDRRKQIQLRPANSSYQSIILNPDEIEVHGKVVSVLRNSVKRFISEEESKIYEDRVVEFLLSNTTNPDRALTPSVLKKVFFARENEPTLKTKMNPLGQVQD